MRTSGWGVNPRIVFRVLDGLLHLGPSSLFLGLASPGLEFHPTRTALPHPMMEEALGIQGTNLAPGGAEWGTVSPGPWLKDGLTFFSRRNSQRHILRGEEGREHPEQGGECGGGVGLSPGQTTRVGILRACKRRTLSPKHDAGWTHGEVTGTPPWFSDSTLLPSHASGPRTMLAVLLCS